MQLSENYLNELLRATLRSKELYDVVGNHLKFQYLPTPAYKHLWKAITSYVTLNANLPSFGILSEMFKFNAEVLSVVSDIKLTAIPSNREILRQFTTYIKNCQFLELHSTLASMWNEGKQDKVFDVLVRGAEKISDFNIGDKNFVRIFQDFEKRYQERLKDVEEGNSLVKEYIPFYIPGLDHLVNPGIPLTDTVLLTAQSGVGKTKALRYIAVQNAKNGGRCAHISAEGSKQECLNGFDATWMETPYMKLVRKQLPQTMPSELATKLKKVLNEVTGEIFIESFETFGKANLADVRLYLMELIKQYGHLDLVTLDYFELFDPAGNHNWSPHEERHRRELLSEQIKNLALELNTRVITATQGSTVAPDLLNDPNFVMTRYNISEFKNVVKPFSFHITMNRTGDEVNKSTMRLFCDKLRHFKANQTIHIFQNYDKEQFCDYRRTLVEGKVFEPGGKDAVYTYQTLDDNLKSMLQKQFNQYITSQNKP